MYFGYDLISYVPTTRRTKGGREGGKGREREKGDRERKGERGEGRRGRDDSHSGRRRERQQIKKIQHR